MILTKKNIVALVFLLALILALPVAIFITGKKQDIRPRAALPGQANLLLSTDKENPGVGEEFHVLMSMQLTDSKLRVSGVDLVLLYDKTALEVTNIIPSITSTSSTAAFDDVIHLSSGGNYDDNFNFLRITLTATRPNNQLAGGTVSVASVTFRAKEPKSAIIKFPDDNNQLKITGISL